MSKSKHKKRHPQGKRGYTTAIMPYLKISKAIY